MGVLNVTPDSFSDGGKYNTTFRALDHVKNMIDFGAHIIDVGGESTRPGAKSVSDQDEIVRVSETIQSIKKKYPKLELVIAWNQPMLKLGSEYLFGASILKNHILISPWNPKVLSVMKQDLQGYKVNKKTVQVPVDWKVDERLLLKMIKLNIQFLKK